MTTPARTAAFQLRPLAQAATVAVLAILAGCASEDGSEQRDDDDEMGEGDALVMMGTGGEDASGGQAASGGSASGGASPGSGGEGATEGTGGEATLPPLEECTAPSIDRYREWMASGEGPTDPATGSLLVADGDGYVAEATFTSSVEWHVLVVWLGNEFGASIDLTDSTGFSLTYSATADFYIQLRPASQWSGGDKWHMPIPSTGGMVQTTFFPFEESAWQERLGTPPHTFADALADASGFVIVGNSQNNLSFSGLRIDGYSPDCLEN